MFHPYPNFCVGCNNIPGCSLDKDHKDECPCVICLVKAMCSTRCLNRNILWNRQLIAEGKNIKALIRE